MNARAIAILLCAMLLSASASAHERNPSVSIDYDAALAASQAAIGKTIRAHALLDMNHQRITLSAYRGKPLIVSFVYTACTDACPLATRYLAKAVRDARSALGEETFKVVTIGFNQPFDTPEAMAAFARQNGIRDPSWSFLSADAHDVESLTRDFGFSYAPTAKGIDHISQVTIVDREGVVYRQVYGESFDAPLLVGPLKELLANQARVAGFAGIWDKVKLFCTVYDPRTGRYRADYSLFVEIFAGSTVLIGIAWFLIAGRRRSHT